MCTFGLDLTWSSSVHLVSKVKVNGTASVSVENKTAAGYSSVMRAQRNNTERKPQSASHLQTWEN